MNSRLEYVDIAKGIGIVLVVCSHSDALGLMWFFMGMFVPIFYFCSGYIFSMKGTKMTALMLRRFRKLFVPYLFFNFVLFCLFRHLSIREIVGVFYSRYCFYPLDVSPNIKFLTSGNYPMWFLTSMIVTYFLFYVIIYYEKYRISIITVYVILTFAFTKSPILLPWSLDTAFLTALFMYAGALVRRYNLMSAKIWQIVLLLIIYVGLQYVGGEINLSVRMYGTSVVGYFLLGTIGSFIVLWGARFWENSGVGKFFSILGQHSLTIFCIQMAFIVLAKDVFQHLLPDMPIGYLTGIFEIAIALLGGWLVSVVIHKNDYLSRLLF
ncbi:MAG: acyltransferase family protein [Prevotella sp.]|nr:acyltransferase family protein [Prevotella sp.]